MINLSIKNLNRDALGTIFERYGKISGDIEPRFRQKKRSKADSEKEASLIIGRWDEIKKAVSPFLMASSKLRATLDAAGAKVEYSQLGMSRAQFREALLHAMCIRNRYTVLDLTFALGVLEEWAGEIVVKDDA